MRAFFSSNSRFCCWARAAASSSSLRRRLPSGPTMPPPVTSIMALASSLGGRASGSRADRLVSTFSTFLVVMHISMAPWSKRTSYVPSRWARRIFPGRMPMPMKCASTLSPTPSTLCTRAAATRTSFAPWSNRMSTATPVGALPRALAAAQAAASRREPRRLLPGVRTTSGSGRPPAAGAAGGPPPSSPMYARTSSTWHTSWIRSRAPFSSRRP
mmetsp:Transcript_51808/g.89243  ORF Transcript_51808/g.89243 Transcript_51808/m.89243 type:complete len:214 (-) Transcript_51808:686-1327(-)